MRQKIEGRMAPVNIGDEMDLQVVSTGQKGDGIAKHMGFAIIIPKAKMGETVHVRISKVKDKFAFAELLQTINEAGVAENVEDTEDFGEQ